MRAPVALDPALDRLDRVGAARRDEELEPQLLEIAREAGGQQPLPLVGGR